MKREILRSPMALTGLSIIGLLIVVAIFAPLIAPYDATAVSGPALAAPSGAHLLGTNDVGVDILSQLIVGTRDVLEVAIPAGFVTVAIGALLGAGAGLLRGRAEQIAARALDGFLAVPLLPILILLAAFIGASGPVLILIIALTGWAETARIIRGSTLSLRQRGFLEVARGLGGGHFYVMRRHLLPALAPIIVMAVVRWIGQAVVIQASLAFLGIGDPLGGSWGMIINRALLQTGIYTSGGWSWLVLPAGLAITAAIMGFTLLGISLETIFSPRLRRAV